MLPSFKDYYILEAQKMNEKGLRCKAEPTWISIEGQEWLSDGVGMSTSGHGQWWAASPLGSDFALLMTSVPLSATGVVGPSGLSWAPRIPWRPWSATLWLATPLPQGWAGASWEHGWAGGTVMGLALSLLLLFFPIL